MNNHVIIGKNNNMIIFLIFLIIVILILINIKVKVNIDFSIIGFEYNFCINIHYFMDVITIYKEDLLKYKNKLRKLFRDIENNPNNSKKQSHANNYKFLFEYVNFEKINFDAYIGLNDVFFTSMVIPIISSLVAIVLQKEFSTTSKRFSIKPIYNKLYFYLKGSTNISIKPKDIIYIIIRIWKNNKKETKDNNCIKTRGKTNIIYEN